MNNYTIDAADSGMLYLDDTSAANYSDHVIMVPLPLATAHIWDTLIGIALVLCTFSGGPANLLALVHFWNSHVRDLATTLYITICIVDTCITITHFPIALSLFNYRRPELFNSLAVCTAWTYIFKFLQRMSIWLVMVLSVYRTIAISLPFCRVSKVAVLCTLFGYCVFLAVVDVMEIQMSTVKYVSIGPFCTSSPLQGGANYSAWVTTAKTLTTVELGAPAILTFFSFLIGAVRLYKPASKQHGKRYVRASVTVALFTALFLSCNMPFFTLMVLNSVTRAMGYTYPQPFFGSVFMSQYSWLLAKILLTVLNATLNPVLYYYRMTGFRDWLTGGAFRRMSSSSISRSRSVADKPCREL